MHSVFSSCSLRSQMSAAQKVQQHPVFIQAQNKVNYHLGQLDKEVCILSSVPSLPILTTLFVGQLTKYAVLNTFEQHTQVPKTFLAIGTILLLALFHFINPLAAPISNFIGWALPAYLSFKALERPAPQDDVQWLTYWVIFGFFNFAESFALGLILYYVPWYYALKTTFVLWLQLPNVRVRTGIAHDCFQILNDYFFSAIGRPSRVWHRAQACFGKRLGMFPCSCAHRHGVRGRAARQGQHCHC
jgi:receptor expression-enhancing protein 5/6